MVYCTRQTKLRLRHDVSAILRRANKICAITAPPPCREQFWYSQSVRNALLSTLMIGIAALASIGTRAQSNQTAAQATKPAAQQTSAGAASATSQPAAAQSPAAPASAPTSPSQSQSKPPSAPPTVTTIVLDPAHGGPDSGARGPSGAVESEVVLDFARAIRVSLEAQGFRVLFTREGDQGPSFDDRSALVNSLRDVVFISLHVSSTGPIGTVRAYSYVFPSAGPQSEPRAASQSSTESDTTASELVATSTAPVHPGLVRWDQAQRSHLTASQQLASLVQIQLAQKFPGSAEVPQAAAVRQLRSIAAPAIAIEVSSVAVTDPQQLVRMGQPLADAVSRAVSDFRATSSAASSPGGPH
jgi:N-acetylmuramoyl-L-alanine amidase